MDKNKALKLLNPVLGLLLACQAGTGLFHEALGEEIFEKLHGACGLLLVLSSLLHLALNWPWVKAAYSGPGGRE